MSVQPGVGEEYRQRLIEIYGDTRLGRAELEAERDDDSSR